MFKKRDFYTDNESFMLKYKEALLKKQLVQPLIIHNGLVDAHRG